MISGVTRTTCKAFIVIDGGLQVSRHIIMYRQVQKLFCLLCDLDETVDEVHFMLYCSYDDLRAMLFSKMSLISNKCIWMNDFFFLNVNLLCGWF